jgi:hypothetical protein
MIAQLDPGFTTEGFWVNVAVQALAAFVGTIGAFAVAWIIYQRTSREDRARFEKTHAHERKLAQADIAYDRKTRRAEDKKRRQAELVANLVSRKRLVAALHEEFGLNIYALAWAKGNPRIGFPLRRDVLNQFLFVIDSVPKDVAQLVLEASIQIDRYNAIISSDLTHQEVALDPYDWLHTAHVALREHLSSIPDDPTHLDDESGRSIEDQ